MTIKNVLEYFHQICAIPHGSGNMEKISEFCVQFAIKNNLKYVRDTSNNVIIYKNGTKGLENSEPIILQGHIDMVCQKTIDSEIDFLKDKIEAYIDGDFLKAKNTTLGADNGIAVAMIMTILESDDIPHPPIEAVFTTDEEIGMIGASALDFSLLKSKKMINLDSEEEENLTVSCAGGSDFALNIPKATKEFKGTKITVEIKDLLGGHSGVEIDKGRVNANILLGRILNHLKNETKFEIITINGGTKANAITPYAVIEIATENPEFFIQKLEEYKLEISKELKSREPNLKIVATVKGNSCFTVLDEVTKAKLIYILTITPNGIIEMSKDIENLVETSLNLGVLKTSEECIVLNYALRSNKESALYALEEKMSEFCNYNNCNFEISGRYLPWEYKDNSPLQNLYIKTYEEKLLKKPNVVAIHAGLECAVFSSKIQDIDCISIGPDMFDVHTVNERLSISSAENIFNILCKLINKCK